MSNTGRPRGRPRKYSAPSFNPSSAKVCSKTPSSRVKQRAKPCIDVDALGNSPPPSPESTPAPVRHTIIVATESPGPSKIASASKTVETKTDSPTKASATKRSAKRAREDDDGEYLPKPAAKVQKQGLITRMTDAKPRSLAPQHPTDTFSDLPSLSPAPTTPDPKNKVMPKSKSKAKSAKSSSGSPSPRAGELALQRMVEEQSREIARLVEEVKAKNFRIAELKKSLVVELERNKM